jgi:hypothetical protein
LQRFTVGRAGVVAPYDACNDVVYCPTRRDEGIPPYERYHL